MSRNVFLYEKGELGLSDTEIFQGLKESINGMRLDKVLIIPPDITRFYSKAGFITNQYYHLLKGISNQIDILPALGTHVPMDKAELDMMFGDIPHEHFIVHDWRNDIVDIGTVPSDYIFDITDGMWEQPVVCEVNKKIMEGNYDLILSVGQVVPHEVIGMANHSKNILVGCGGKQTINGSHMIGAVYGMERMMGKDNTPVRKILDYAMEHFLNKLPIIFVLTVTTENRGKVLTRGLFIGPGRKGFEAAVELAQKRNINFIDKGIKKCVVFLEPKEFKSTWLGNKAVYRTRMAIADGGELIVLGPGITRFGEDDKIDKLIRKYGYTNTANIMEKFRTNKDLQENMSAAAHLIHGSSEGRFQITYAVNNLSQKEIESVNYKYVDYQQMIKIYNPEKLTYGWNIVSGEEIYYIPNPALGLWIDKNRF